MAAVERLLLCPEERLSVQVVWSGKAATLTTSAERCLCLGSILVRKVGSLELRISAQRRELVELQLVDSS